MNVYYYVTIAVSSAYILFRFIQDRRRKAQLGKRLCPIPNGLNNMEGLSYVAIFIVCVAGALWYPFQNSLMDYKAYIFGALMGLFSANSLYPLLFAFTEKGLYERGVNCMVGVMPYDKFSQYQIIHRKKNKIQVILSPKNRSFGKAYGFLTHERDKKKIESIVKAKLNVQKSGR
jgi:hypothetical protein